MATNVTNTTFLSQYKDDYRDSDHYHRILFNNGRALQARELTQMQTIIQSEIGRMANYIFQQGGVFGSAGSLSGAFAPLGSIRVTALPNAVSDNIAPSELVGLTVSNSAGVEAVVKAAIVGTGGEDDIILVKYITTNNLQSSDTSAGPRTFLASETLSYTHPSEGAKNLTIKADDGDTLAIGKGSFIETPEFNTYIAGHLVFVESQSLVLDATSDQPNTVVGFIVSEQIITVADNVALYDNSGANPNLTSPGADRLKITLTLAKESSKAAGQTFVPLAKIVNGVVRILNSGDNQLNELGRVLASRTDDITGDFIVSDNPAGTFGLQILNDSDDNFLQYKVEGGVAFIGGNRIERASQAIPIRVEKPRNRVAGLFSNSDVDKKTNEFVSVRYGNFFLADSLNGLVGSVDSMATLNLHAQADLGGTQLGTIRIRGIEEYDNKFRLHMFDLKMDSSAGTPYSLRNARSVGFGANHFANISEVNGVRGLHDKEQSSLIFPLGRKRVNQIDNVELTVQRIDRRTSNGSGQATFQASGAADNFIDTDKWIVQDDATGEIYSPPTTTGSITTSATVTGLNNSAAVTLLGYEVISNAQRKTKTLATSGATQSVNVSETVTPDSTGRFKLTKADIYLFRSIVDATTSEDITYKYNLDNGQRDNFYDVGQGTLRKGYTAPAGNVTVTYDYFYHSTGDFFGGVRSYPDLTYRKIPTYIAGAGYQYRLSDVIDMRPIKGTDGTFTGTGANIERLPRNGDFIKLGEVEYWQPRIDKVTISPNGLIRVKKGKTNTDPVSPRVGNDEVVLHTVKLEPYTLDAKDVQVGTEDHRGFKMADLRRMERRLTNVETISSLTLAEMDTNSIDVADPNDATLPSRIKLGITGDTFDNNIQTEVSSLENRSRIDVQRGMVTPLVFGRTLSLEYDSARSSGTIKKGNNIWPSYTEEVYINQNIASKSINVNQFEVNKFIGSGEVTPPRDAWNVRKKVDANYEAGINSSSAEIGTSTVASQGLEQSYGEQSQT